MASHLARQSTTHLTWPTARATCLLHVHDRVDGGNGIVVPGYGFLLNNELTDFDFDSHDPSQPAPRAASARAARWPDDRREGRQAVMAHRLAGRLDDLAHRAPDARQPDRPRASRSPTRSRCRARSSATRRAPRPSGRSSTPGRARTSSGWATSSSRPTTPRRSAPRRRSARRRRSSSAPATGSPPRPSRSAAAPAPRGWCAKDKREIRGLALYGSGMK